MTTIGQRIASYTLMRIVCFIFFSFLIITAQAGGIRGIIKSEDAGPLAYATIFVKQTGTGSATDFEGKYEVQLVPGRYDVLFQYLGYAAITRVRYWCRFHRDQSDTKAAGGGIAERNCSGRKRRSCLYHYEKSYCKSKVPHATNRCLFS
ncbi:MAG: carboxypeptidase-like regulatory domain-containing protein [Flammeovirgaceae bacterium]|nr:carboxypeptidase-like regulatory domain-containing protein [Flammeovirgaceae bacterium]